MKNTIKPVEWAFWNPGLDNDHLTLREVYETLPTYEFSSYPLIVLALENPKSPIALPGKCNLLTHDLIHALLGRGLFVQDEAFVIGYTMGTSKKISRFQKGIFKFAARYLYPKKYRFKPSDLIVYDLGFMAGQANKTEIFDIPLAEMMDEKLGVIRERCDIDKALLRTLYSLEISVCKTRASERIAESDVDTRPAMAARTGAQS